MVHRRDDDVWPPRNHILAALKPKELADIRPHLKYVEFDPPKIVFAAGDVVTHVDFIESGLVSLVRPLSDGTAVEVGVIGSEGVTGASLLLGMQTYPSDVEAQLKVKAFRMTAKAMREAAGRNERLYAYLLGFIHALHIQVTQTAACNVRHSLQQRLARWLLSAHDRWHGDDLRLRHEFIAMMLGQRRAGVTAALGKMRKSGHIATSRGHIRILNRRGLEKAACECYGFVRDEYKRLLP